MIGPNLLHKLKTVGGIFTGAATIVTLKDYYNKSIGKDSPKGEKKSYFLRPLITQNH